MTFPCLTAQRAVWTLSLAFLAACGGNPPPSSPTSAPVTSPPVLLPPASTTLSVSTSVLALAVQGNARSVTVTNTGTEVATALALVTTPALPAGSVVSPGSCGDLAVGASCVLTITPGATASAAPGDTTPVPATLRITGSNTNTVTTDVSVLDHGSVHQSGYVFSLDDTTPNTGSVGGKAAALTDVSTGVFWSANAGGSAAFDAIPGISHTDVAPPCHGNRDGACNTDTLVGFYATTPSTTYAAGLCRTTQHGRSDWYLPSICEMGFDATGNGTSCGTSVAPLTDNMQSNLVDKANVGGLLAATTYWSSTQFGAVPAFGAFGQRFDTAGASQQGAYNKNFLFAVRCARALTV